MTEKEHSKPLLLVEGLQVTFPTPKGELHAVNDVSYDVRMGEVVGIVGESGSGKSVSAYTVMGLLQSPGRVTSGSVSFQGRDVLAMSQKALTAFRGGEIGMVCQDPMRGLDPVFTIGWQLMETIRAHEKVTKAEARRRCIDMLAAVGLQDPEGLMSRYPYELSGGMRQRVLIGMALLCNPKLLIADEPTTALDVTIQDQIVRLLRDLCAQKGMSMVFITHNFGIVADICDRVVVMYGGRVMERGRVDDIFAAPAHPYTRGLMQAIPSADLLSTQRLIPIDGQPIDPVNPPSGCPFSPRCPMCMDICRQQVPGETRLGEDHAASCWRICENRGEDA